MAAGQSKRFYSGVGIFNWYYFSSPPQIPRRRGVDLELGGLKYRGLWLGADVKEGRGALYTSTIRGCYARAISGTVIQYRQEKRAAEKGGPQHGDPQGR